MAEALRGPPGVGGGRAAALGMAVLVAARPSPGNLAAGGGSGGGLGGRLRAGRVLYACAFAGAMLSSGALRALFPVLLAQGAHPGGERAHGAGVPAAPPAVPHLPPRAPPRVRGGAAQGRHLAPGGRQLDHEARCRAGGAPAVLLHKRRRRR
eukprot:1196250-Prorocentrum_minimum.AAC.6